MHRKLRTLAQSTLLGAAATLLASGCGATVHSTLPPGAPMPASLALLPADYSVDIPRERINLVRQSIINQLRNRGFIVLDEQAVTLLCSSPACPERDKLAQKYIVDGFATLRLNSFSRNNFLAGYYNELSGQLSVSSRSGQDLVTVTNTENEEGGLLLQSGQLFQAILSSVKNTGDEAFDNLADKFSHTIVEKLPPPAEAPTRITQEGVQVALNSATATWSSPTTYRVCTKGTPASFAYLVTAKNRTNLREVSPGLYCRNFSGLVAEDPSHDAAIELRSAFGTSVRQDVSLPSTPPCDLKSRVEADGRQLRVSCARVGSSAASGCSGAATPCSAQKVVLFTAPSPAGPFSKAGEFSSASAPLPAGSANVQVMTVGAGGVASLPVTAQTR